MHKLEELQKRLLYGSRLNEAGGNNLFELLNKPIEEVYEILAGFAVVAQRTEEDNKLSALSSADLLPTVQE